MASNAGGIRAGRAFIEMGLNDSALIKGLKSAEAKLKSFGAGMAGVGAGLGAAGAAITAPMTLAVNAFADAGSALNDMAVRTGLSVEALSMLGYAAGQTGTDLETVEGAVRKMQKALLAGSEENQQAEKTFAMLGISIERLAKLSPDQQFQAIAASLRGVSDPTLKAAMAMQIFGKSGTALLPMVDDLSALSKEAKDFGLVMSTDAAASADALGDSMSLLSKTFGSVVRAVGGALAPAWTEWNTSMARTLAGVRDFIDANKPLVSLVYSVGFGLAAAGVAFVALGAVITGIGATLGVVASAFGAVAAAIGFILSPVGLVVAALAGLTTWFFTSTKAGGATLAWLGDRFGELAGDAVAAFGAIGDALKAGDIALAGQILWAALKVEWLKGITALKGYWNEWGVDTVNVVRDVQFQIAAVFLDMGAAVRSIWASLMSDLTGSWGTMVKGLIDVLSPVAGVLAKVFGVDVSKSIDDALGAIGVGGGDAQARANQLAGEQASIEADRQAARQALTDAKDAEADARKRAADSGLKESQDALTQAQEDLQAFVSTAAAEKAALGAGAKRPGGGPDFSGLDSALGKTKAKVDVAGSFSGAALRGLGAGESVADDQLKEQKKSNDKLDKINRTVEKAQAKFGP